MEKLNYCLDCMRVFNTAEECAYCKSSNVKELKRDAPVNIIGSKLKGRVLKSKPDAASILIVDQNKNKMLKEIEAAKIKKIL